MVFEDLYRKEIVKFTGIPGILGTILIILCARKNSVTVGPHRLKFHKQIPWDLKLYPENKVFNFLVFLEC